MAEGASTRHTWTMITVLRLKIGAAVLGFSVFLAQDHLTNQPVSVAGDKPRSEFTFEVVSAWAETSEVAEALASDTESAVRFTEAGAEVDSDALAKHYNLTADQVSWLRDQHIPDVEWPVLLETVRASGQEVVKVVELRQGQKPWPEILKQLNVQPSAVGSAPVANVAPAAGETPPTTQDGALDNLVGGAAVKFLAQLSGKGRSEVAKEYAAHPQVVIKFIPKGGEAKAAELKSDGQADLPKELPAIVPGSDPRTAPGIDNKQGTSP